jgi:hypothetical protein
MQTKYAILNPSTGIYTSKDTYEEACAELAAIGYAFYVEHCHGHPCAYVEVQEDGSEVWRNNEGVVVPSAADIQKEIEAQAILMTRTYANLPKVTL